MVTIKLLGDQQPDRWAKNRVFLALAARHPERVEREVLLQLLWPGDPAPEARNRLRVALSRLRDEFSLEEHPEGVRLDPSEFSTDLAQVRVRLSQIADEPEPEIEYRALLELLPLLAQPILRSVDDSARMDWQLTARDALHHLAELAHQREAWETAREATEAGLRHLPTDPALWELHLRAMGRLGRAQEGRRAFMASVAADEDGQLNEVRELLPSLLDAEAERFAPGQSQLLLRVLAQALESDPSLTAAFFGSGTFRSEMLRSMPDALPLLRQALALGLPEGEERERIQVRVITCLASMNQDEEVIREARAFLTSPIGPARRRIALLNLSFCLHRQGQKPEAYAAIEEAIRIAEETGFTYDAWQCRAQRAAMLLIDTEFEDATQELAEAVAYFQTNRMALDPDRIVIQGNYGLALGWLGRWDEARVQLETALEEARVHRARQTAGLVAGMLGWVLAHLGQREAAAKNFRFALRTSYRLEPNHALVHLRYVAHALRTSTPTEANRIFTRSHVLREQVSTPQMEVEAMLAEGLSVVPGLPPVTLAEAIREAVATLNAWSSGP